MKAEDLALRIEAHVSRSFLIYGIKALHLTKENALANEFFYDAVEILKSKGYAVRESNFVSKSRLPLGESIGFEISLQIDEILSSTSREYFLLFLKNTIASNETGKAFKLDRPNKQLDKDFWSAIYKLGSIGVGINQKSSDFADDYTHFEFTWPDQKVNNMQDNDNTIETIFDDKVIVDSKWIKKSYPRSKGLFLVVKEVNGDDVAYSDASTNLRYAHISKQELLRDYDYLTQEDIDNM